jgi:hypothetical protein
MPIFYCAESQKRNRGERGHYAAPDAAPDAVTVSPDASGQFIAARALGFVTGRRSGLTSASGQFNWA